MVDRPIKVGGCVFFGKEGHFVNLQAGLAAFAEGEQDQRDLAAFFVAHQAKPLGFQADLGAAGAKLCQTLRLVDQEKVAAVFQ